MVVPLLLLDACCEVMVILSDIRSVQLACKLTWYMRVTEVCACQAPTEKQHENSSCTFADHVKRRRAAVQKTCARLDGVVGKVNGKSVMSDL